MFKNYVSFSRYLEKSDIETDPKTPFRDLLGKIMVAYCEAHDLEYLFFNTAFQFFFLHFEILKIIILDFMPLKTP